MELNLAIKRDFRRAELFAWIMPLPATRSSTLIASPTAVAATVASPARIANSAFLTNVRAAERYERFRSRRLSETRIRFLDDLLFAKSLHLISPPSARSATVIISALNSRSQSYHVRADFAARLSAHGAPCFSSPRSAEVSARSLMKLYASTFTKLLR